MIYRIIAAAAMSLALGSAALAQEATANQGSTSTTNATDNPAQPGGNNLAGAGMPSWSPQVTDAFFSDGSTLRSPDEIRTNWSTLSAEQQAQVRSDCATSQAAAGSTDQTTTGSTATGSSGTTAGSTEATAANDGNKMASMAELCSVVGGM